MQPVFIWTLFALSSYSVVAQDLKSSTAWRSPNITLSKEDRINIAGAALETAINNLNQSNGQFIDDIYDGVGSLYAQMAEFDGLTNQTKYKDMLKQYFALVESTKPGFLDGLLSSGLSYGYAAARAYNIYQDPDFLSRAVTSWDSARRYTISDEQAASGTMDTKQFTFPSSCKGATLTGGTYYDTDPNNTNIASTSTGFFLVLSALLAEATSSKTYIDAAVESAYFIQSHLLNTSNHVVLGSIEPSPNCAVDGSTLVYDSIGSGLFIEGMVVLADITAYNASTNALLRSTIADVTTDSLWQGVNGVYDNNDGGGHYIVRALASLYERNTTSSDLREYIKEYIGVQYNSVIELARSSNESTIYGLPWTGPPGTSFDDVAQITALTALISAIQLADNPTSSDIPTSSASASLSPQSSTGSVSSSKKEFAGIIAGSVVGGLTLLGTLIAGALFLCKRHRQRNESPLVVNENSPMLTPFTTAQDMAASGILGEQHPRNQVKSTRFSAVAMGREPSPSGPAENGNQVGSTDNPPAGGRREYTLLEELLRSLNDRISRDRWNAEEMPPGYHEE